MHASGPNMQLNLKQNELMISLLRPQFQMKFRLMKVVQFHLRPQFQMKFRTVRLVNVQQNLQQNELEIWLEILGQQLNLLEVFQILMLNLGPVKEVAISLCPYQEWNCSC